MRVIGGKFRNKKINFTKNIKGIYNKDLDYLSKKYKFKVVEDACHAFGGYYENKNFSAGTTGILFFLNNFSVPPVDMISIFKLWSFFAKSTMPVLSETLTRARLILIFRFLDIFNIVLFKFCSKRDSIYT